jgi:blue copper oxidase
VHASSNTPTHISRRQFLHHTAGGLALLALGGLSSALASCTHMDTGHTSTRSGTTPMAETPPPDLEIALRAAPGEVQLLPGAATQVWRYEAEVIHGRADAIQPLPGSYLGPILRFRTGERVRIHFTNELSEESIVHWHGLHVPEEADGHPHLAIGPGETYIYDFPVISGPGTYWYHPHPHGRTGPQVNYGLAGLLIVDNENDRVAGLPEGDYDVPLVIQDRTFDDNNQFTYIGPHTHEQMFGFFGNEILVNGVPEYVQPVATRPYRLRLLNGSNARIYKLGFGDNRPLTVIGTDGGLLAEAVERPYVTLSPGERIELWADFSGDALGSAVVLESKEFSGSDAFPIMHFRVEEEEVVEASVPTTLTTFSGYREQDAVNRRRPRTFEMDMAHGAWRLNGKTFEMDKVARNEIVKLGDLEIWEFVNESSFMAMPHPMHIHNVHFQVIGRSVLPEYAKQRESVEEGYVDEGWKDTVLVMPGERVKLLLKFDTYAGLYLYHCHNLEHEDMGMMRNYRIRA